MLRQYPNSVVFIAGVAAAAIMYGTGAMQGFVEMLGVFSYVGALALGMLYASAVTAGFATLAFVAMGSTLHPLAVALVGGFGAMVGDLAFFGFMRNGFARELRDLARRMFGDGIVRFVRRLGRRPHIRPLTFLLGAALIASPLPDELGVAIFAAAGVRIRALAILSFTLNTAGIFLLASIGTVI